MALYRSIELGPRLPYLKGAGDEVRDSRQMFIHLR